MGLFGIMEDYSENSLSLDQLFKTDSPSIYLFRAQGQAMSPFIVQDDLLIVDRSLKATSGDIVVGSFEGEFLCKQLVLTDGRMTLRSVHKNFRELAITEENFLLFGVVTGFSREMKKWKGRLRL